MSSIAVIGAGAWGTALAIGALRPGQAVTLWARDPVRAAEIAHTRQNPRLPGITVPETIHITTTLPQADIVLLAVPVQHLRSVANHLPPSPILVCCAKGVELGTNRLPLEILAECQPQAEFCVLTGPNFAHEIARGLPAAALVAARSAEAGQAVIAALATHSFRLYASPDPLGAQLGGAAKNVIAIAAGAAIGAGLGENARAALVTRGLAEISRLIEAEGGDPATAAGLSGLGDLLLTCTGPGSRNFAFGHRLGQGHSAAEAQGEGVVEGAGTAPALLARAQSLGVALPICQAVADLVTGRIGLQAAIAALLARPAGRE